MIKESIFIVLLCLISGYVVYYNTNHAREARMAHQLEEERLEKLEIEKKLEKKRLAYEKKLKNDWNYVYSLAFIRNYNRPHLCRRYANVVLEESLIPSKKGYRIPVRYIARHIFNESEFIHDSHNTKKIKRKVNGKWIWIVEDSYGSLQQRRVFYEKAHRRIFAKLYPGRKFVPEVHMFWIKLNIKVGCSIIRDYLDEFDGDFALAYNCYNVGPNAFTSKGNRIWNRVYVNRIINDKGHFEKKMWAASPRSLHRKWVAKKFWENDYWSKNNMTLAKVSNSKGWIYKSTKLDS